MLETSCCLEDLEDSSIQKYMEEERMKKVLESLDVAEKAVAAQNNVCDVEIVHLSEKMLVKIYNLQEFREIRKASDVSTLENIGVHYIAGSRRHGKSGSLLFFTENFKYAIKTIRKSEFKCLRRIVVRYKEYFLENPESFLCRILGCYSVCSREIVEHVIIMRNVLRSPQTGEVYDLKGTCVRGRKRSAMNLEDIDWARNSKVIQYKRSGGETISQIRKDIEFLRLCKVMDYSLLVHFPVNSKNCRCDLLGEVKKHVQEGLCDCKDVCFGIVDILTPWSVSKILEKIFHTFCCEVSNSCVDPNMYADRFLKMIELNLFEHV